MWRFRRKQMLVLFLALGLATVATAAVGGRGASVRTATGPEVVAAVALARGSVLAPAEVRLISVPLPFRSPGALTAVAGVAGRVLSANLAPGEPVSQGDLETASEAGLSYQIPAGLRAETVAVSAVSGVGGHLEPGNRVDAAVVLAATSPGNAMASLFLTNVPVLAVESPGQTGVGSPTAAYTSVTLAVTPEDAVRLALAAQTGTLQLFLRPMGATQTAHLLANEGSLVR